ncbi:CPBP family glutamic-type intramembrane protease [Enemella sp. A6]|uniref:CPBP family glutamic-type intramembrane protease n=1 Tax=Enemella sp. A6 TaxID=3440152 RepID=UPI003EBF8B79
MTTAAEPSPLHRVPAVRWQPGRDTLWAGLSIPLMWAVYWGNTMLGNQQSLLALGLWFVVGNLVVCTLLPAWVVTRVAGEGWAGLGFTKRRWWLALGLTLFFGLGSLPFYFQQAAAAGVAPVEHLAYNLVILWEPLFVAGFLQLRFTRAFGWLPGIILATLGFAAYHVGSVPAVVLATFVGSGLTYCVLMAFTRNIWTLFPLAAGVSSAIGTLQAGLSFEWSTFWMGLVVLVFQVLILVAVFARRPRTTENPGHR